MINQFSVVHCSECLDDIFPVLFDPVWSENQPFIQCIHYPYTLPVCQLLVAIVYKVDYCIQVALWLS